MLRITTTIACVGLLLLNGQEEQKKARPDLVDLVETTPEELFADEFARSSAIAKRYESSSRKNFQKAVAELEAYCDLTDRQRRRMQLAVQGASKKTGEKFIRQVAETKELKDIDRANSVLLGVRQRMQTALADPTITSFWKNTIEKTLTDEQLNAVKENQQARVDFQKQAWVYDSVREVDRFTSLRLEQRDAILKRLREWIRNNDIPPIHRARRGPWKFVPKEPMFDVVMTGLDEGRRSRLIEMAPHAVREEVKAK